MLDQTIKGVLIPFAGTSLGAACVFFLKEGFSRKLQQMLMGFAAGVMVAASVWSLLLPAIEQSVVLGRLTFLPAAAGFFSGVLLLLGIDWYISCLHKRMGGGKGISSNAMLMLAVTLHNLPEGMAVGVACAGLLYGNSEITAAGVLVLSLGIGIQNIPEGAIISLPMKAAGKSRSSAFLYGVASGVAEPLGAVLTILAAGLFVPVMPWLLSFSAGAMMYVVAEELLPEIAGEKHSPWAITLFAAGFSLMMALDVMLG